MSLLTQVAIQTPAADLLQLHILCKKHTKFCFPGEMDEPAGFPSNNTQIFWHSAEHKNSSFSGSELHFHFDYGLLWDTLMLNHVPHPYPKHQPPPSKFYSPWLALLVFWFGGAVVISAPASTKVLWITLCVQSSARDWISVSTNL